MVRVSREEQIKSVARFLLRQRKTNEYGVTVPKYTIDDVRRIISEKYDMSEDDVNRFILTTDIEEGIKLEPPAPPPSAPFMRRMRGAVIKDVYAWIPAVIGIILFVWLGTSTGNTLILAGGVLFSLSLAVPKGESLGAFKAIIKFVGILLLSIGFLSIYPFAGLVALFLGYISMPVKVRVKEEEQTYNNAVGFSRMILGIMLAIFILNVLGGDNALKLPMFLIALGFFFAIPEASEEIPQGTGFTIINYLGKKGDSAAALSGILILAGVVLGALQLTIWSATWIIFISVGLVGAFTAFRSHAAERGTMGAPIVALLLITLSTSYPALLGESIFGAWWPSVESSLTSITAPLGDAWAQATAGTSSAWLMMTNPSAYYEQQMAQQQASANIKSGGTMKSIEVSGDFLINNVPEQALLASATLENKGEFKATNINVTLMQLQMKSKDKGVLSPQPGVKYKFMTCSGVTPTGKDPNFPDTCTWPEPSYNGDMKLMTFTYGDKNVWGDIGKCDCAVGSDKKSCLAVTDDSNGCKYCYTDATTKCADSGGVVEYPFAGKTISVGFGYSFDYIVNVSLGLQLMQSETLNDLLLKKQIRLQDVEAQYSGGPVRASIWTMKQPVRAGEDTLAVITILNQGTGTVKSGAEYVLTIPFVGGMSADDLKITEVSSSGLKCDKPAAKTDSYELHCKMDLKDGLGKQKDAKYGFIFNYNIPKTVDSKTVLFVGNVNYQYQNSYAKETQITWVPPQ